MANVIKTVMTYPLNGQVDFAITFEYLARKFVQVTLIGKDRKVLTLNSDYRFSTKMQITTNKVWGTSDGYQYIEIRRFTSATERLVDFADGSILRAYDLNIAQIQTIHIAEEARDLTADTIGVNGDGDLDARGRRIVNVANPTHDLDALNLATVKQWDNSALNSANRARSEADRAWTEANRSSSRADAAWNDANRSESQAGISTTNAQNTSKYKDQAQQAATDANKSAQQAAKSTETITDLTNTTIQNANNASKSADRAKSEADRAKSEADKLGNMNSLGSAIQAVVPPTDGKQGEVQWRYLITSSNIDVGNKLNVGWRKTSDAIQPYLSFHYSQQVYCGAFLTNNDGTLQYNGKMIKFNCDTTTGNLWSNHIAAAAGITLSAGQFWNHAGDYFICDKAVRLDNTYNQVPAMTMRNGEGNNQQCVYTYMTINRNTQQISYDINTISTNGTALYRFTQSGLQTDRNMTISYDKYSATYHDNGDITCNSNGVWEGGNLSIHINNIKNRLLVDMQLGGVQTYTVTNTERELNLSNGQVLTGIGWSRSGSNWTPAKVYFRELIAFRGDGSWYVIKSQ